MPVAATNPPTDPAADCRQRTVDWLLFAFTCVGALVVYVALFTQSLWGFVIGEIACGLIWLIGWAYKRARCRRLGKCEIQIKSSDVS